MKKKEEQPKSINELIIDESVKQFKVRISKIYSFKRKKKIENMSNGYCKTKNVRTKYGNIKIKTPRDRNRSFKPAIIEKGQTKLTGFERKRCRRYTLYVK